jgi:hypothetical protein
MLFDIKEEVLGRSNHLLSCDVTQTAYETKKWGGYTARQREVESKKAAGGEVCTLCSRNLSLILRCAALGPIVSNRSVKLSSCSEGTSVASWALLAVWNLA